MTRLIVVAACVLLACSVLSANAFYLPGIAPRNYIVSESVSLKVNKLDSVKTLLPYDYYSLKFCPPEEIVEDSENLGEILSGDRIENSPFKLSMRLDEQCRVLCQMQYGKDDLDKFASKIADEYRVNMIVDNLPAATKFFVETEEVDADGKPKFDDQYEKGFALGFTGNRELIDGSEDGVQYVHNHITMVIFYHQDLDSFEGFRVVGFEVNPVSVKHEVEGEYIGSKTKLKTCDEQGRLRAGFAFQPVSGRSAEVPAGGTTPITWTYDVMWLPSAVKWASRWDLYLKMTDSKIHWFSIINSIMIVLFLTGMIAMIMLRTLHRDFARYNELETADEAMEETGWKLIYGDVFRPPANSALLSIMTGSGVQVIYMCLLTLAFAVLGFLSPANRGSLMTACLMLFVFMGSLAGYHSTSLYKFFELRDWKKNTLFTALFFPGIVFTVFFVLNLFVWQQKSSGAVPFTTLIALLLLWFGISVPLVYLGSHFAWKRDREEPPCKIMHIPRLIPEQPWYMHPMFAILVGGILPFGAVFIEIFFIMSSVWLHQFYYVFGFLFLVFIILAITCGEITIVMCYFQLCGEDYHWWWRAFLTSGSSALYLFMYSVLYFYTKLDIMKFVPGLLYFGYMALVSFTFFLLTGTFGFYSCLWFVKKIYSSIKVD
jgi:transmembrane 9 superfamily member 2/4